MFIGHIEIREMQTEAGIHMGKENYTLFKFNFQSMSVVKVTCIYEVLRNKQGPSGLYYTKN